MREIDLLCKNKTIVELIGTIKKDIELSKILDQSVEQANRESLKLI